MELPRQVQKEVFGLRSTISSSPVPGLLFRAAFPGEMRAGLPAKPEEVTPCLFSFCKVEISLQSSFQPGMKLEVANKSNPDTYWVATIITTCGQLLLLRYCGYGEDRRADFWCDVMTADLHPVGWCTQNNKVLMPPDGESCLLLLGPCSGVGLWVHLQVSGGSGMGIPHPQVVLGDVGRVVSPRDSVCVAFLP